MTDLDKLIEAVEAGGDVPKPLYNAIPLHAEIPTRHLAARIVNNGKDLTAALDLHEALLPEWGTASMCQLWDVTPSGEYIGIGEDWSVELHHSTGDIRSHETHATAKGPARAWLLAILKALKAKGDA